MHLLCFGFSFNLLCCERSKNQALTGRTPSQHENPCSKECLPMPVPFPGIRNYLTSPGGAVFGTIAFAPKNPSQQLCIFSVALMSHRPAFENRVTTLACTIFRDNRVDGICPENVCQQLSILTISFPPDAALPQAISHDFLPVHDVHASISLPPNTGRPKLFTTVSCPSALPAPSQRSSPGPNRVFPKVSLPSMMSALPSRFPHGKGS